MKTYAELKAFVDNRGFHKQRKNSLEHLNFDSLDKPIVNIIKRFWELDFCFTLQSCYGHFVHELQTDGRNTERLPVSVPKLKVEYRLAYIAFCIANNQHGKTLLNELKGIQLMDKDYIQVGCAGWFWRKQVNSFVIQVEPERFKYEDKINIEYPEALHIEKVRDDVFLQLDTFLANR